MNREYFECPICQKESGIVDLDMGNVGCEHCAGVFDELDLDIKEERYSDDELREMFDDEILPYAVERYGQDDEVAITEAWNNWTDALYKDGQISFRQYDELCYEG